MVPRVPPDLHAARGRDHPLHQARPRVHRAGGPRGRGRRRRPEAPARRRSSSSPDPDDPADVIGDEPVWHDGEVVGWITSGGYGHHVKAVDRARATCRPSWRRRTARAAAVRDRDHRPPPAGPAPARAAVRPARAPDAPVTEAPAGGRRIVVDGRPIAFAARRLRRGRDPPGRRGAGPRRDAVPGRRLRQLPGGRSTASPTSGRARSAARPGHGRRAASGRRASRRCPRRPARPDAAIAGRRSRSGASQIDVAVIGGGSSGPAAAAAERPASASDPRRRATAIEVVGDLPGADRSSPGRPTGCSTSRPSEIVVATGAAEIQPVCPGNDLAGIADARGPPSGSAPPGVDLPEPVVTGRPASPSGSRATPTAACAPS